MIDVTLTTKAKASTSSSSASVSMAAQRTKSAETADYAERAGMASRAAAATEATHATEADHAKNADEATHATEADHAKNADEATHAAEADHAKDADNATKWDQHRWNDYMDQPLRTTDSVEHKDITAQNINNTDTIKTKNLEVTGLAHFFELMIDKVRSVGGKMILSAASAEIAQVANPLTPTNGDNVYRCYFRATDGEKTIDNCFEVGDMVICQTCNLRQGSQTNASNRYYWRVVKSVSTEPNTYIKNDEQTYHFIDLYATSNYAPKSQAPKAGDTIVQLGNISDASRGGAIVISAYNDGWLDSALEAPSIAQYYGIGSNTAFRWDLAYYRQSYWARNGNLMKGQLVSVANGKEQDVAQVLQRTEEMATEEMQIWFYEYSPTLDNEPAASWIKDGQADYHVGDIFYNTARAGDFSEGTTWRFTKAESDGAYSWRAVDDQQMLKALQLYADAANDGILSAGTEKARLLTEYQQQYAAMKAIRQRARAIGIDYDSMDMAWGKLATMLNANKTLQNEANTPAWLTDIDQDIRLADYSISADTYRGRWQTWHREYANLELRLQQQIQAEIINRGDSITLQVKQGMKRTGIDIDAQKIRLDAQNTEISGDLHIRGVLVENYTDCTNNEDFLPEGVPELVACDMVHFKSVTVRSAQKVLLPRYDSDIIRYDLDGNNKPFRSITINGLTEGGVKLSIAAKYDASVAKWRLATSTLYKAYKNAMPTFNSAAIPVFADPRLLSYDNYYPACSASPDGAGTAEYEGGVFVCNGQRGRILLLMPGQTLHLTSAIEQYGGRSVLVWYVDNGSEFSSIAKDLWIYNKQVHFKAGGGSSFPMEVLPGGSDGQDQIFAPPQLDDTLIYDHESGIDGTTIEIYPLSD